MSNTIDSILKTYQCHKIVHAVRIDKVEFMPGKVTLTYYLGNGPEVTIIRDILSANDPIFARYMPTAGDYFVVYDHGTPDRYVSFSPRAKFEAGYTELKPQVDFAGLDKCVHGVSLGANDFCEECEKAAAESFPSPVGQYQGVMVDNPGIGPGFEPYWIPTVDLRFIHRDGYRILQQKWHKQFSAEYEWRDVPLIEDEANAQG